MSAKTLVNSTGCGCYVRRPGANGRFLRPGDDFNARADWAHILVPRGWTWAGCGGDGSDPWCRPGKTRGTGATANLGGSDLLFEFSSNADPFDEGTAYSKFHAFMLLEHDGDFHAAAQALRGKGYGAGRSQRQKNLEPFQRYAHYPVRARYPRR